MQTILHQANTRGVADHGWLYSHHTFSFASYHNPERMGFGALRVINDDIVAPSMGFGTHPHRDMEIISIPLSGSLKHRDTMGNDHVISKGEVQAMTAGVGIAHSEYNHSSEEDVNFLQIWVLPKKLGVTPGYSQKKFDSNKRQGKLQLIVSPDGREDSVSINQDAYFSLIDLKATQASEYKKYVAKNGVYFFVIKGEISVDGQKLRSRDGLGVESNKAMSILAGSDAEVLIMEVPLFDK